MKALFVTEIGDPGEKTLGKLELRDIAIPEIGDEEVLVKVAYASICGSDGHLLKGELGEHRERLTKILPIRIGHEMSGIIERVGATAAKNGFKPGDRVTGNFTHFCNACHYCRSGMENFCEHPDNRMDAMGEYISWHMNQIYKIPESVDLLNASLTEPMTIAFNAVQTGQVKLGSNVAIFGAGGIGLMAVQLAKLAGAAKVTVIEVVKEKRDLALTLGADYVIDPINEDVASLGMEHTGNYGFETIIESSGASSAAQSALEIVAKGGHIVYFSMYNPDFNLSVNLFKKLYFNQANLHGMYTSADIFPQTIKMLERVDFSPIIQKVYNLEDYEQAFADSLSGKYPKVVLKLTD
jgi:2-desacetyl-2-hydroxyethyl bacteriochlorophyllide A dehydrogenase